MLRKSGLFFMAMTLSFSAFSGQILSQLPDEIAPHMKFIFYSHGYIVEGTNPMPEHARWGIYEYPNILNALSGKGVILISEHRAAKTNPYKHAQKLTKQVNQLLAAGVPASNITLIGFSRGGFITAITSSYLENNAINYVILAACTSSLAKHDAIKLHGHILSIFETSDSVGSCKNAVKRSPDTVVSFKETSISTGKEHGAFFTPIPEWVTPVKQWIMDRS